MLSSVIVKAPASKMSPVTARLLGHIVCHRDPCYRCEQTQDHRKIALASNSVNYQSISKPLVKLTPFLWGARRPFQFNLTQSQITESSSDNVLGLP